MPYPPQGVAIGEPLIKKSIADMAADINGATTAEVPAAYFEEAWVASFGASILNHAKLTAAKAASILDHDNLTAVKAVFPLYQDSQYAPFRFPFLTAASICLLSNISLT